MRITHAAFWTSAEKRGTDSPRDTGWGLAWIGFDFWLLPPLALLALVFTAAWLMLEVVFPVLFFLAYVVVRSALAAIANDEHDCQGHWRRALVWGFAWSSAYMLPLAGTLAVIHWFAR